MSAPSDSAMAAVSVDASDKDLADLYQAYVRYQNLKDMAGLLSCVHSESNWRATIQKMFEPIFNHYTLDKEVQGSIYVGSDGEFAYCRFNQTTKKIAGPDFRDLRTENLAIFRRDGAGWKIWNCFPLWIEPLVASHRFIDEVAQGDRMSGR